MCHLSLSDEISLKLGGARWGRISRHDINYPLSEFVTIIKTYPHNYIYPTNLIKKVKSEKIQL
jgi:hypothetical protein